MFVTEMQKCCVYMCWMGGGGKGGDVLVNWDLAIRNTPKPLPANLQMSHCSQQIVLAPFFQKHIYQNIFIALQFLDFVSCIFLGKKNSLLRIFTASGLVMGYNIRSRLLGEVAQKRSPSLHQHSMDHLTVCSLGKRTRKSAAM